MSAGQEERKRRRKRRGRRARRREAINVMGVDEVAASRARGLKSGGGGRGRTKGTNLFDLPVD